MAIIKVQLQHIGALWLNPGDIDPFLYRARVSPVTLGPHLDLCRGGEHTQVLTGVFKFETIRKGNFQQSRFLVEVDLGWHQRGILVHRTRIVSVRRRYSTDIFGPSNLKIVKDLNGSH